ncbi:hypothetical protein KXS07_26065 [Inquilinus limosus]|uniref:hypothetical protein n=1 Tax=Inquilinus limosus TaxID=171674 RepID=UPI003F18E910
MAVALALRNANRKPWMTPVRELACMESSTTNDLKSIFRRSVSTEANPKPESEIEIRLLEYDRGVEIFQGRSAASAHAQPINRDGASAFTIGPEGGWSPNVSICDAAIPAYSGRLRLRPPRGPDAQVSVESAPGV